MPRPHKCRKVCRMPNNNMYGPLNNFSNKTIINMTVDEYETIRLIDLEGMTQEECALQMSIARTTVQKIYEDARKKLACSLVNGDYLIIEGGNYVLCDGINNFCGKRCHKIKN